MFIPTIINRILKNSFASKVAILSAGLTICVSSSAETSPLVFRGQNVGLFPYANPSSVSTMMNSVSKPSRSTRTTASLSTSSLIQNSLASKISSMIYQQIFDGTDLSGYYDLGDGSSITYLRDEGYISIDIVNEAGTTTITVPDI